MRLKLTYKKAKTKAWTIFSKYIRIRDEHQGCYTCGAKKPYKQMQGGHFIQGRHMSVFFDERNVHAQCYHCNVMLNGNLVNYTRRMIKDYGEEVVNELERLDSQTRKYSAWELIALAEEYKEKVKSLLTYGKD